MKRRRQVLAVAAVASAVAGALVGSRAGDAPPEAVVTGFCEEAAATDPKRAAGQQVMVRMAGRATPDLLDRARSGQIGGVILFPPAEIAGDRLARELRRLQAGARRGGNPPLLVAIDQEGGTVERLPALPPALSPFTLAQNDNRNAAMLEGSATGFQLRELGITVNLAPVLDVPSSEEHFMAPRAFGSDPRQVARLGLAFASGQRREGVAATAKHFPGLGRATENTDIAPTAIPAGRAGLDGDIAPFAAAIDDGIELVMVSSASYPRLGSPAPAVLAPQITTGLLRDELGFEGVTISDDLGAPAIAASHPRAAAAVLAARAGTDVLLFASDEPRDIPGALVAELADGELTEAGLRASCGRIVALKERLEGGGSLD